MAFGFYTAFTVHAAQVPNTDQTNFPVGIIDNTGLARLKTVGNGGHVQNSNGYDIRPYADSSLTTPLTYELVYYDAATGKIEMWVNIASLSHTVDTPIYLAYGDATISTDGSSTGTWDTNYKGVYHLPNGTTLTANDSTSSGFNGTLTNTPTATAGQIDGGANIASASSQSITMGNNLNLGATDFTLEAWINPINASSVGPIIAKGAASAAQYSLTQGFLNSGGTFSSSKKIGIFVWNGVGFPSGAQGYHTTADVVDGNWHRVICTRTSGVIAIYIDGTSVGLTSDFINVTSVNPTGTASFFLGKDYATDLYNGKLDEIRVSPSLARTADWISTDWNNQNSPSTFYAVGAEQATSIIAFDAAANSGDQASANTYSGSASWSGTNRMLAIDVSLLGPSTTVTSMTYGGAACTFVGSKSTVTSLGSVEQWRICSSDPGAPGTGANTLVVNLSGTIEFSVEWVSYTGVNQSSPTEAFNSNQATNTGSATDASVIVTSTTDQCWIHAAVVANDTSITANQTTRNNISGTLGSGANEDNNAPVSPAGSTTMSYSGMGITTTWAIAGYAIRPLGSSSGFTLQGFLALLGLGA